MHIPANMIRCPNVGLLLAHRLRRWPNSKPMLGQRVMFAVYAVGRVQDLLCMKLAGNEHVPCSITVTVNLPRGVVSRRRVSVAGGHAAPIIHQCVTSQDGSAASRLGPSSITLQLQLKQHPRPGSGFASDPTSLSQTPSKYILIRVRPRPGGFMAKVAD